jgi:dihydrofolate reductase
VRAVILQFWLSLDGYSVDPGTAIYEVLDRLEDPDQEAAHLRQLEQAGTHVMGRVTYEGMAKTWPVSDHPFAAPMNDIPKVVFSRSLAEAAWQPARIARGDLAGEIARLKAEPGGDIVAYGGTQFARSLVRAGLVDEYRLWVMPATAGQGAALFTADAHPGELRLLASTAYPSGILQLRYAPAGR